MSTLFTSLSGRTFSQYRLGNVSNLERLSKFNQTRMTERSQWFQTKLPNEHPLVQLLTMMGIRQDMTQQELVDRIELKRERWLTLVNPVSIYRTGRLHSNLVNMEGIHDLLISLPDQLEFTDYFTIPESEIVPFIPVYGESLDYDFRLVQDKPRLRPKDQLGIIGIDIAALAIGYWRALQSRNEDNSFRNVQPDVWLTGYPLLNCQLLNNRLFFINYLYSLINEEPSKKIIIHNSPITLNDISSPLSRYLDNLNELHSRNPVKYLERLFVSFPEMDTLSTDKLNPCLWIDPGKYGLYQQTRWVYNIPYMKSLIVLLHFNNLTSYRNGHLESMVKKWLREDIRVSLIHSKEKIVSERYIQLRNQLSKLV